MFEIVIGKNTHTLVFPKVQYYLFISRTNGQVETNLNVYKIIKDMLKKFLIGTFAIAGLALAMSVSAAYDFGTTTLKVGSRGEAVKAVQTVVGATPVDGIFGPMTAAKVKAWQASNGLVADGLFGAMSKAKA